MKLNSQMNTDALSAITTIAEELGLAPSRTTIARALYLCERHGSSPVVWARLPRGVMGRCLIDRDGLIEIDAAQCGECLGSVIVHELTHRLCYCSARFEQMNSPHMADYDRRQFQELIAYGVEWLFRNLEMSD